ncbi:MAG: hypothetical protein AB7W44_13150 [Pyrinomonadaceae bacterium]
MKLSRKYLIAVLLLAFGASANGQEPPKSVLVDEFGLSPCEDVLSRTDSLAADLGKQPDARALIVTYPPSVRPKLATDRRHRLISSTLQLRGIERRRFSFYVGKPFINGQIRTQVWKLPQGSELPFTDAVLWKEDSPDTSRAFMFGYEDEIGICPTFVPKNFARLILENPGSRGHIVVRIGEDPLVNRFYFAKEWINELVEKQGVPRKRLRLFFAKGEGLTGVEFWYVPKKKR